MANHEFSSPQSTSPRNRAGTIPPEEAGGWSLTLKLLATTVILAFAAYVCWKNTLASPDDLYWNSWALSEWFISYEGGFVRRGLSGQFIRWLAGDGARAMPIINGLVFSTFVVLCGLLWCLLVLSRRVTPLMAIMLLLVPGGVYGMVMGNEFYFRKEMIFHICLAAAASLLLFSRRNEGWASSRMFPVLAGVLIATSSLVLPLVHEAFLFISAVPMAVIIYWLARRRSLRSGRIAVVVYLGIVVAEFALLALFKGNSEAASAIWASIHPDDQKLISLDGEMRGGIEAIGWDLKTAIKLPLQIVTAGHAWQWAFTVLASAGYLLAAALTSSRPINKHPIAWVCTLYSMCFVASLPLFILGWDWGRWIAAVNLSVAILICAAGHDDELPVPLITLATPAATSSRVSVFAVAVAAILFGLSYKLPECCLIASGEPFHHTVQKLAGQRSWRPPPGTVAWPLPPP